MRKVYPRAGSGGGGGGTLSNHTDLDATDAHPTIEQTASPSIAHPLHELLRKLKKENPVTFV